MNKYLFFIVIIVAIYSCGPIRNGNNNNDKNKIENIEYKIKKKYRDTITKSITIVENTYSRIDSTNKMAAQILNKMNEQSYPEERVKEFNQKYRARLDSIITDINYYKQLLKTIEIDLAEYQNKLNSTKIYQLPQMRKAIFAKIDSLHTTIEKINSSYEKAKDVFQAINLFLPNKQIKRNFYYSLYFSSGSWNLNKYKAYKLKKDINKLQDSIKILVNNLLSKYESITIELYFIGYSDSQGFSPFGTQKQKEIYQLVCNETKKHNLNCNNRNMNYILSLKRAQKISSFFDLNFTDNRIKVKKVVKGLGTKLPDPNESYEKEGRPDEKRRICKVVINIYTY